MKRLEGMFLLLVVAGLLSACASVGSRTSNGRLDGEWVGSSLVFDGMALRVYSETLTLKVQDGIGVFSTGAGATWTVYPHFESDRVVIIVFGYGPRHFVLSGDNILHTTFEERRGVAAKLRWEVFLEKVR